MVVARGNREGHLIDAFQSDYLLFHHTECLDSSLSFPGGLWDTYISLVLPTVWIKKKNALFGISHYQTGSISLLKKAFDTWRNFLTND